MKKFAVLTGREVPTFLTQDDRDFGEETALWDTADEARQVADVHTLCEAYGYVIVEWDEGFVTVHA